MDALLQLRAQELATEFADQATTVEEPYEPYMAYYEERLGALVSGASE